MTRAEEMRKITEKVQEERAIERKKQYDVYVEKIIKTKVKFSALLGRSAVMVKIKKAFAPSVVAQHLTEKGFDIKQSSKNGRQYIMIKW